MTTAGDHAENNHIMSGRAVDGLECVRIESLAYTGVGVAHLHDGRVMFVENALPGDLASLNITEEHPRFLRAEIKTLVESSPERVEAPCPYHALCGGCGLQHLAYPEQLKWKCRFIVDALERIGSIDAADALVSDTVASPATWGYRNKVELEPCWQGNKLQLGFHAKGGSDVVPVERCMLVAQRYAGLPTQLAGILGYVLKDASSALKRVGIRVSQTTGDVELALWMEAGPCNRSFIARVLSDSLKTSSLVRVLTAGSIEKRDIRKVEVLAGRGHWREDLGGFRYRVSAPSFFQTNTPVAKLLVERVLEALEPDGRRVADLYSGVGTFTLPLAKRARQTTAIEMAGSSVRDLRRNLTEHKLEAEVLGGDVTRALPDCGKIECAVVDPPRCGLGSDTLHAIVRAAPSTLVYVSCDPGTLARDVKGLVKEGYRLASVTPFDLFPQTWHVESVAKLVR
jgi:23S rRNA (uracil1939-C5)-methyltransferase